MRSSSSPSLAIISCLLLLSSTVYASVVKGENTDTNGPDHSVGDRFVLAARKVTRATVKPTTASTIPPSSPTTTTGAAAAFHTMTGFSRTSTLADGRSGGLKSGPFSPTYRWQSSGLLQVGSCSHMTVGLDGCARMYLDSKGMLQDPPPTTLLASPGIALAGSNSLATSLEDQAAADDDNSELYYQAFPQHRARRLDARSTCPSGGNSTGGTKKPPSPRQRIELFSWPGADSGSSWTYTWTTFLTQGVSTSEHFFHLWQILSREQCGSGPIVTLDATNGMVQITDLVRPQCGGTGCPSVPISRFWDRTVEHRLTITYGPDGTLSYSARKQNSNLAPLISYYAVGYMGASPSLKFGMYRSAQPGNSKAESFVGAYTAVKNWG